jgi:hypothetical protein
MPNSFQDKKLPVKNRPSESQTLLWALLKCVGFVTGLKQLVPHSGRLIIAAGEGLADHQGT